MNAKRRITITARQWQLIKHGWDPVIALVIALIEDHHQQTDAALRVEKTTVTLCE